MGNTFTSERPNKKIYTDNFRSIKDDEIEYIKENYTIINVNMIAKDLVHENKTFIENPEKTEIVNDMLDYYLTRNNKYIYQNKTDLLCNEEHRICMCNIHAEAYRKILCGINYRKDEKYISWFRELNDHFYMHAK